MPQGGQASFQATLTSRGGFAGTVSLSLVGAPPGLALSPASVSLSPNASQTVSFTLAAASSAPTGTHSLTLRAASGSLARTQPLSVEVTPPATRLRMDYEWGQVLMDRDLALLSGKRAFLRVHLTADPRLPGEAPWPPPPTAAPPAWGTSPSPARTPSPPPRTEPGWRPPATPSSRGAGWSRASGWRCGPTPKAA